jgi:hypothetical protein
LRGLWRFNLPVAELTRWPGDWQAFRDAHRDAPEPHESWPTTTLLVWEGTFLAFHHEPDNPFHRAMPGLDKSVVASINPEISLSHTTRDVQSDFILAPHDNAIFLSARSKLWERPSELLRSGKSQPELALTISASGCPPATFLC